MKILFILNDHFPYSGACTSLLNNMFFCGGLADKAESISVVSVTDKFVSSKSMQYKGIDVYNLVLMSKVSVEQYKGLFWKCPIKVLKGMIDKVHSKLMTNAIDSISVTRVVCEMGTINLDSFDVIVAVMGHFEIAAAALELKKRNPNVKFVLYQVDPCSSNESYNVSTKKEREDFEKNLYTCVDRIITTPILLKESEEIYSKDIVDKMIPMEFPNVVPCFENISRKTNRIRCIFTGSIYGDFRDPEYTLRLFDNVEPQISFEMIGSVNPSAKTQLDSHNVLYHGSKSLEETKTELASADILVNIGNKMTNQVPSKLFEYISYGKPIINICKNRNCPTLPYLERYKYVLNLYEEDELFEEQVKLLNEFVISNYQNRMSADEIEKVYRECTPQFCAEQMLQIFRKL